MTDVTCWQLTRGHLGWTVSACFQGTRQSSAYLSLSSGAGSGPHPLECPEQSFALSDTVCPFLVFWRHRGGGGRDTEKKTKRRSEATVQICDYPTALLPLAQCVSDVGQDLEWQGRRWWNWMMSQNVDEGACLLFCAHNHLRPNCFARAYMNFYNNKH